jgi:predicted nucleic acid-binding protein
VRVVLDAGVFIAAAKGNRITRSLMTQSRERAIFCVLASTIAEFYRGGTQTASEARLLNAWRPEVVAIDEALARRAGVLLSSTGGSNTLDALLVAGSIACGASKIFTTDMKDIEQLVSAAGTAAMRPIAVVKAD